MSLVVMVIGAAHALPVVAVACATEKPMWRKALISVASALMLFVAAATGKRYFGVDAFFILAAALLFWPWGPPKN